MSPSSDPREEATLVLQRLTRGEEGAAERLLPLVYDDLRARARRLMASERSSHTLQPTALVHEAWMRLIDQTRTDWTGRAHFLSVATTVMRRILVDHARRRDADKRGGEWARVTLDERVGTIGGAEGVSVVDLDRTLERLEAVDERRARVAALVLFAGLEPTEIAEVLGVSRRTAERDWRAGRAFLVAELSS